MWLTPLTRHSERNFRSAGVAVTWQIKKRKYFCPWIPFNIISIHTVVYFKGRKIVSSCRRRPPVVIELHIIVQTVVGESQNLVFNVQQTRTCRLILPKLQFWHNQHFSTSRYDKSISICTDCIVKLQCQRSLFLKLKLLHDFWRTILAHPSCIGLNFDCLNKTIRYPGDYDVIIYLATCRQHIIFRQICLFIFAKVAKCVIDRCGELLECMVRWWPFQP
jgi:hypothetical protein